MLFDNTKIGFDLKSDFELKRALFLFKVISNSTITKIGTSLLKLYTSIWFIFFKQYDIFSAIFLEQIYRQFCAGLDHKTSMKTVNKLFSKNVYSYLHYSVEGGKNDASFDIHCQSVINSIEFASTKKNLPFTVFKPTAIGRITEYEKSDVNQSIYNRFDRICKIAFEKNIKILIDAEEIWVQSSIDNLTAELVDAITNDTDHFEKISKQLNKVESINKRLDSLDKLFLNIDKIAEKEKGGRVYLKNSSEFKEKYEIRFEKSVKDYEKYLEDLSKLFIS